MDIEESTNPYAIHYNDTTFVVYDLTEADFERLKAALFSNRPAILSIGLFVTHDIRAVVKQKPVEPQAPSAEPELTPDEQEWYEQNKATWENFGKEEQAE